MPLAWGRGLALPVSLEPPVPSSEASSSVTSEGSGHTTLVTKAALPEWGGHSGQLQVTRSLSPHRGAWGLELTGGGECWCLGGSGTPESWGREGCEPLLLGWVLWTEGSGEGTTY